MHRCLLNKKHHKSRRSLRGLSEVSQFALVKQGTPLPRGWTLDRVSHAVNVGCPESAEFVGRGVGGIPPFCSESPPETRGGTDAPTTDHQSHLKEGVEDL